LAADADRVRTALAGWLDGWPDRDIVAFGRLLSRFNASLGSADAAGGA
jgi:hypothetical protein